MILLVLCSLARTWSASITVEAGGKIEITSGGGSGGSGSAPTQAEFDALKTRVDTMEQQFAELIASARGRIMPGLPPPPAPPRLTPSGNLITIANGVIAGPSTQDGNMDGAGPGSSTCPPVSGQPGSAVMDGTSICTLFAQNAHSRLNIIFKFPEKWEVNRIWLLRGVHSPNYGPKRMVVYAYSGDREMILNSKGEFDDTGIAWTEIGTYDSASTPKLANANTCLGGSFNSGPPKEGDTRWVDNLDFSAPHDASLNALELEWVRTDSDNMCAVTASLAFTQVPSTSSCILMLTVLVGRSRLQRSRCVRTPATPLAACRARDPVRRARRHKNVHGRLPR